MQSSPRAARETRIEGQETAELNDQAPVPEERWYSGLVRLFGGKSASQKTADTNAANPNALLAFPSEAISRPEPAPIAEAAKRTAQKTATPATPATVSPKLVRAALIISAVAVVAAIGAVAVQRYPLTPREPRPGNLTINTRPIDAEVLIDGTRRGTTPLTLSLTPGVIIICPSGNLSGLTSQSRSLPSSLDLIRYARRRSLRLCVAVPVRPPSIDKPSPG